MIAISAVLITQVQAHAASTVPGVNNLVSVNGVNGQGGNGESRTCGISGDGNTILFTSRATNLPISNASAINQLYLRDVATGTTTRVDVSTSGVLANDTTSCGVMSRTGRYAVFVSKATNLIDGTTTPIYKPYLRDIQAGTTSLINVGSAGMTVGISAISDDGRYLTGNATNAYGTVSGITRNGYTDPVVLDTTTGTWTALDIPATGSMQSVYSYARSTSCDGSLIVFDSPATNIVPGQTGSGSHVFLADIRNGLKVTDITPGATLDSTLPYISCNGQYIVYSSKARNIVSPTPSGVDSYYHLVRYDRIKGTSSYVDSDSSNTNFNPDHSSIFASGFFAAVSDSGDVVLPFATSAGFGNYNRYIYLKHLSDGSGTLEHVQKNASAYVPLVYDNSTPSVTFYISADGKYATFATQSSQSLGLTDGSVLDGNGNPYFDVIRTKTGL